MGKINSKSIESYLSRIKLRMFNFAILPYQYPKLKKEIPEIRQCIMNNKKYKDVYKGKRCFVLGNGPSLRQENLALLHDEYVFTVNQAFRLEQFQELHSNFHFWADSIFFNLDMNKKEDLELFEVMKNVSHNNSEIKCFFPIQQKPFIDNNRLNEYIDVNYYYSCMRMYDGFKKEFDYSRPTIAFSTVVQWCISMAIYMGFSEIYLLGCDCTSIRSTVNSILQQNNANDYGYAITQNEKNRLEKTVGKINLEDSMQSCLIQLQDYRRLYNYCTKRNIKLVNCSSETVLTSVPRATLSDVLGRKA